MADVTTTQAPPSLATRYREARALTETLAGPLSAEDQTVQSMPDVSPTKWHRAHTSWFFETFLLRDRLEGYRTFDDAYAFLFNSYYVSVGDRHTRAERGLISRPGIAEIARYRAHVDESMDRLLLGDLDAGAATLAELGIHHEQQHQELLLMDIKHVLSRNPTRPAYQPFLAAPGPTGDALPATPPGTGGWGWSEHPGGIVEIGHDGEGFAFDNELPRHPVLLRPFALADAPVSCGDWLAFMDDGGYTRPELWLSEGWAAAQASGWDAPLYWFRDLEDRADAWQVFTLGGPRPVSAREPVCHVSLYEADAFARWAGCRLPTELEWEAAAGTGDPVAGHLELDRLHPRPAGPDLPGGGVWQWTSSSYAPYPGFRTAPGAVGEYNGKFMVNQYVLRGGSCATPAGHWRATYRNFFPASSRWAFAGVRVARDG
jgi:ergothioneine biosynthesis protein EgtB